MLEKVQCPASTTLVDPAPPTDMRRAVCPTCGAYVAFVGTGKQARWDTHLERVPLAERPIMPSVVDRGDLLQHEIDRADAWMERHAS